MPPPLPIKNIMIIKIKKVKKEVKGPSVNINDTSPRIEVFCLNVCLVYI